MGRLEAEDRNCRKSETPLNSKNRTQIIFIKKFCQQTYAIGLEQKIRTRTHHKCQLTVTKFTTKQK